jgi:hypothetical protein
MAAITREAKRLFGSAKFQLETRGAAGLAGDVGDLVTSYVRYPFVRKARAAERFPLGDRRIPYFIHHYNRAWRNERAVELALAFDFLDRYGSGRVLEVGNVLAHYGRSGHDILDKYESSPGVLNDDIVDLAPAEPYDALLSISTLEHVGWDETPRDREKTVVAYQAMRKAVKNGGPMLLTCPVGQNDYLDEHIAQGRIDFPEIHYLKRVSKANDWEEVELKDVLGSRYDHPYRNANALFIGIVPAAG